MHNSIRIIKYLLKKIDNVVNVSLKNIVQLYEKKTW